MNFLPFPICELFVDVFKYIAIVRLWHTDWEMCGDAERVSEKFFTPIITKTLITARYRINQLIDANQKRPDDVPAPYWKKMVEIRSTDAAKQRLAQMRSISLSKGSTSKQLKAIEREVVSRLVSKMTSPCSLVVSFSLNRYLASVCPWRGSEMTSALTSGLTFT